MKKTLLEKYLAKTSFSKRNSNPFEEGIVGCVSDIVQSDTSVQNLQKALPQIHKFHRVLIDRSKVKDDDELEKVALCFDLYLSMMIIERALSKSNT